MDTRKYRRALLPRVYGITVEQYNEMLNRQQGTCAMCGELLIPGHGTHIDHNHSTKAIRGILCHTCNKAVGWVEKHQEKVRVYLDARPA